MHCFQRPWELCSQNAFSGYSWGSDQHRWGRCLGTFKGQTGSSAVILMLTLICCTVLSLSAQHVHCCLKRVCRVGRAPRNPLRLVLSEGGSLCSVWWVGQGLRGAGHPSRGETVVMGNGRGCVPPNKTSWCERHQAGLQPLVFPNTARLAGLSSAASRASLLLAVCLIGRMVVDLTSRASFWARERRKEIGLAFNLE